MSSIKVDSFFGDDYTITSFSTEKRKTVSQMSSTLVPPDHPHSYLHHLILLQFSRRQLQQIYLASNPADFGYKYHLSRRADEGKVNVWQFLTKESTNSPKNLEVTSKLYTSQR